jgi:hypothetical protein
VSFGISVGRFLGFVVHENGIEIYPKKVEAIKRIPELTCKISAELTRKSELLATLYIKPCG